MEEIVPERIPGLYAFKSRARLRALRYSEDSGNFGRKPGHLSAIPPDKQDKAKRQIARRVKTDMANIKKNIDNLSGIAEEALEALLTTIRSPAPIKDRNAAAAKLLEFTMAKPVARTEVAVHRAEAWLDEIAADRD